MFQAVHCTLSLPLFPPHTLPLVQCGISPVGNNLPQFSPVWVLPTGFISLLSTPVRVLSPRLQILWPAKLLKHKIPSPWRHRSDQEHILAWISNSLAIPLLQHGILQVQQVHSALWTSIMGCWGTAASPPLMVFTRDCRGISATVPGTYFPPAHYWSWGLQSSFSHIFSPTSLVAMAPVQQNSSPSQFCFSSSTTAVLPGVSPDQLQVCLGYRWYWLHVMQWWWC